MHLKMRSIVLIFLGRQAVAGPSAAVAAAAAAAAVAGANPQRFGHRPSVRPNAMRNRERQLEALRNMEERIHKLQVVSSKEMKCNVFPFFRHICVVFL